MKAINKQIATFISITILLFSSSCGEKNEKQKESNERVSYYKNGKIKKRVFRTDSTYIVTKFDSLGNLTDSLSYDNHENLTGVRKHLHYDTLNTPYYSYVTYKNNIKEGKAWGKYLDGEKKFDGTYENDFMVRSWNYFDKYGKRLTYEYFSLSGARTYLRKYKNGIVISTQGEGIGYWAYASDTITIGSTFAARIGYANPPNSEVRVFVAEELNENKEPKDGFLTEFLVEQNQDELTYVYEFNLKGTFEKGFGWVASDSIHDKEELDYDILKIFVRDLE